MGHTRHLLWQDSVADSYDANTVRLCVCFVPDHSAADENNDANVMQEPALADGVAQFYHMLLCKQSKHTSTISEKFYHFLAL